MNITSEPKKGTFINTKSVRARQAVHRKTPKELTKAEKDLVFEIAKKIGMIK